MDLTLSGRPASSPSKSCSKGSRAALRGQTSRTRDAGREDFRDWHATGKQQRGVGDGERTTCPRGLHRAPSGETMGHVALKPVRRRLLLCVDGVALLSCAQVENGSPPTSRPQPQRSGSVSGWSPVRGPVLVQPDGAGLRRHPGDQGNWSVARCQPDPSTGSAIGCASSRQIEARTQRGTRTCRRGPSWDGGQGPGSRH